MLAIIIIAEVSHHGKFGVMTAYFHRVRYQLVGSFFCLALVDFILLELSDVSVDCDWDDPDTSSNCPLLNPDENGTYTKILN